jgi:GAF domain-containing protein
MGVCAVSNKPIVYNVEDTGLWGDALREGRAVITNDYQNLSKPTKKGYPHGHVEIVRHMNLPIYEGDFPVLVVGVGNKPTAYTLDDARLVEELMTEAWRSFQQTLWETTW